VESSALRDFRTRLEDVQQLIDAHSALTRLKRADAALQAGNRELVDVANVVTALVTDPGVGRRKEVHALNNAGVALLSGHLQGFIVDIFEESAKALLAGNVQSVNAIVSAAYTRGNPNPVNIKKLFNTLGFDDVLDNLSWTGMGNKQLREKLRTFNELRNRIVHGANERTQKQILVNHLSVFRNFAYHLDQKLREEIKKATGTYPW